MIIELRAYANVVWNARLMLNAVLGLVAKPRYLSSLDIEQSAYVIQFQLTLQSWEYEYNIRYWFVEIKCKHSRHKKPE